MVKAVNQNGLCAELRSYIQKGSCGKHLLVWCQYGTYCVESIRNVIEEIERMSDIKVRLTVNDSESADIPAFIQESVRRKKVDEVLIVTSFLPWGREEADGIMAKFESEFCCIRYEADPSEWLSLKFAASNFNKPIIGFLREHPGHLILPYGEKPMRNTVGPCPASWTEVDFMWSDQYYRNFNSWKKKQPEEKIRLLLLCVATCIGNYEPMISEMHDYLLQHQGYDELLLPEPPPASCVGCLRKAAAAEKASNFRNVFDDNGRPIWETEKSTNFENEK